MLGFLFARHTAAQLCAGSLGDPVINITFGSGTTSAGALDAATTSYSYVGGDCPNDGTYTVRSTTVNCFSTWHTLTADHTGNPQGFFMLVNASFDPGDFYIDTVKGLCSNTVYEFSAWVMNMVRSGGQIMPDITFTIEKTDGTLLGSFSTGAVPETPSPRWNNYGLFFKTPAATFDVVLRMRNNAPGGIGNDIALDDITFRPCGPLISAEISGSGQAADLCESDTTSFLLISETAAGYDNPVYQWQLSTDGDSWQDIPGANSLTYLRRTTPAGNYLYRLAVSKNENGISLACRIASSTIRISVHGNPVPNAGPDRIVIKGETTALDGKFTGDSVVFIWVPDRYLQNSETLTPSVSPTESITYTLTASSVWGCTASDSVFVKVVNGIYIPTAFTPNGDGRNDLWRIPDLDPSLGAEVWVFNRYGEVVYHAKGSAISWDGKLNGTPQAANVFVYLLDLKRGKPPLKGFIALVR